MQVVLDHLREHYAVYVVIVIALLPIIYVTRRYSVPAILYTVEYIIYLALMHFFLGALVRVAAWFKDQSSMDRAFGRENTVVVWETPWLEFWKREAYTPGWLFWMEVSFAVIILVLMWKIRPMRVRRRTDKRPPSMKAADYVRKHSPPPSASGKRW
ncbi:MAG: hypothetical protein IT368_18355 [Candidatus Hydrogenedentes bacterium]|nr:hypothetical protein [Candidatus Hydrogenedentota bacterium]